MLRALTKKVTLAGLTLLALIAIAAAFAFREISATRQAVAHLTDHTIAELHLYGHFHANVFRVIAEAGTFARTRDPEFRTKTLLVLEMLRVDLATLEALDTQQDPLAARLGQRAQLQEQRRAIFGDLQQIITGLFQAIEAGDQARIDQQLAVLKRPEDRLEALHRQATELLERDIQQSSALVDQQFQSAITSSSVLFSIFSLIVMFGLYLVRWRIVRPLKALSSAASRVAAGDLGQTVQVTNNDEIGDLQAAFNLMVEELHAQRRAFEERTEAEQARAAAEHASKEKSAFLARMSHELRTPLTAILGYSELLEREAEFFGYKELIPDIGKIHSAGDMLLGLINNILDLSKIEAGKMELHLEPFEVATLVKSVAAAMQPIVAQNENTLQVRCDQDTGSIYADPIRVRQVLVNLLGNAAKFTDRGTITFDIARERAGDSEWVHFRITDTGIGIAEEDQPHLFQEFAQASAALTGKYGGSGLGLAISRHFCRMMGGDITLTSEAGAGATFTVRLPAYVQGTPPPAAPAERSPVLAEAAGRAERLVFVVSSH